MFYVPTPMPNGIISCLETNDKPELVSTSNDYETNLEILHTKDSIYIRDYVLHGNLRSSKIRSLYWRTLLENFSWLSVHEWVNSIRAARRRYCELKTAHTLDPHRESFIPDDNPLSQDENSVWYRYFCDKELKRIILQDVMRTSPEKKFFQSPRIQEIMVDVLFLFARQNPEICYRQGMHEILAPILYVIHQDFLYYNQEKPTSVINAYLSEIMDTEYLEHDGFWLFSFVMRHMSQYYQINCVPNANGYIPSLEISSLPGFSKDYFVESSINIQLNELQDELMKHDRVLHDHLKTLNIPFTAFGIRWLRLLFGREFSLNDLLILWDAIFAFSSDLVLINCVLLSMLIAIREELLKSDYLRCMNYLMKYPSTVNIKFVIKYAIHLKKPSVYKKPQLPVFKSTKSEQSHQLENNNEPKEDHIKNKVSRTTILKNISIRTPKKTSKINEYNFIDDFSSKTFEMLVSELKHMRVVMSLCKLKLYQYHETLSTSIAREDVRAQQALTGIHELCSLLDIDHFALKSNPLNPLLIIETAHEAGEISLSASSQYNVPSLRPTMDAVAMFLPPPKSDIDMTVFSHSECATVDASKFPIKNPIKQHLERHD